MTLRHVARVLPLLLAIAGSTGPTQNITPAKLITALNERGVTVSVRTGTGDCEFANGWYRPESRLVTICRDGDWGRGENIALAHETVHAIQHCRGNLIDDQMIYSLDEEQAYEVAEDRGFDLVDALQPYYLAGLDDEEMSLEAEAVLRSNTESLAQIHHDLIASCS